MSNEDYTPVSCATHSEYELAIMRKKKILLTRGDTTEEVLPLDILIREHAEYLLYEDGTGERKEVRLDYITEAHIMN